MFRSIRARMTAVFALSVALLMALASGGLIAYARHSAERNAMTVLSSASDKLDHELREGDRDESSVEECIDDEREDLPADLAIFLTGDDGRVRWSSVSGRNVPRFAPVNGTDWRTTRLRADKYRLVIALPWTETESSLRSLTESLALLSLFVVALATAGAWILVGRTLSPIGRLSRQANAATVENLRVHLEEPSQDAEIAGLVVTLNGLLSRLSDTASAKGRFYSAASHELRTPLQALSGHLELALTRDRAKEEYRGTLEEAYRQTQRLVRLTRNLLMLYQVDSAGTALPCEPCDLAAICMDALSQSMPIAEERGLRISIDMHEPAPFSAPGTHAEVLVRNLVENAVRYASDEGRVDVRLAAFPDRMELSIFNECALPSDFAPEALFEPFVRPDSSRSAATGGTGLGLTICKSIADANGWTLSIFGEIDGLLAVLGIPRLSER